MSGKPPGSTSIDVRQKLISEYLRCTSRLSEMVRTQGIPVRCNPDPVLPEFICSPLRAQRAFIRKVDFLCDVCSETIQEHHGLLEDKMFVWHAIKRLGVRPTSSLLEEILPRDYVEIYDRDGIQVFRNFEFCKLITYSLEEIMLFSWDQLYGRAPKYTQQIIFAINRVLNQAKGPIDPGVDRHISYESRSNSGREYELYLKMFAPLKGVDGRTAYFLCTAEITRLR